MSTHTKTEVQIQILLSWYVCIFLCVWGCGCWSLCLGDKNVLVLLDLLPCHLTSTASKGCVCVRVCVYTCTPMPPRQPCRAVFLFSNANFIPSQLVLSQGFSMQAQMCVSACCKFILVHTIGVLYRFFSLAFIACYL